MPPGTILSAEDPGIRSPLHTEAARRRGAMRSVERYTLRERRAVVFFWRAVVVACLPPVFWRRARVGLGAAARFLTAGV